MAIRRARFVPTTCDDNTALTTWFLDRAFEIPLPTLILLINQWADLVPTYEALLFQTRDSDTFFGYNRECNQRMRKTERDVKRFWDSESDDIQVLAMHGTVLADPSRTVPTYRSPVSPSTPSPSRRRSSGSPTRSSWATAFLAATRRSASMTSRSRPSSPTSSGTTSSTSAATSTSCPGLQPGHRPRSSSRSVTAPSPTGGITAPRSSGCGRPNSASTWRMRPRSRVTSSPPISSTRCSWPGTPARRALSRGAAAERPRAGSHPLPALRVHHPLVCDHAAWRSPTWGVLPPAPAKPVFRELAVVLGLEALPPLPTAPPGVPGWSLLDAGGGDLGPPPAARRS